MYKLKSCFWSTHSSFFPDTLYIR